MKTLDDLLKNYCAMVGAEGPHQYAQIGGSFMAGVAAMAEMYSNVHQKTKQQRITSLVNMLLMSEPKYILDIENLIVLANLLDKKIEETK